MTNAVIVQARMGSTRLPGKVLKDIGGRTVLQEVLHRCHAIPNIDVVVCAIPDQPEDQELGSIAERTGAVVVRGSATDVLSRYCVAADAVGADIVMRVTSDCPLIDPGVCGEVLRQLSIAEVDFVTNSNRPSFPHGLDCEAFRVDSLRQADREATTVDDREHVIPWLLRDPGIKRAFVIGPGGAALKQRWTLDFPEDLEFFRAVFALLPPPPAIPEWTDVAALIDRRPDIFALNAVRHLARA